MPNSKISHFVRNDILMIGQLRVISWFPRVRVRHLTDEELDRYDPERIAFLNVNTPEEFARAEERASREGQSS